MANETSFNLNVSIQHWREKLAQSPAFHSENLDELETHLRDSIAALHGKGLSAEEAFIIAARRMGTRKALEQELGKVNGFSVWFERALWVLLATQLWTVIVSISDISFYAASWLLLMINGNQRVSGEGTQQVVLRVAFFPFVIALVIAVLWWRFPRRRERGVLLFRKLLDRPLRLALVLFFLCALLKVVAGSLFLMWYVPKFYSDLGYYSQIRPLSQIGHLLIRLYAYVILASLTFWVARKRLRERTALSFRIPAKPELFGLHLAIKSWRENLAQSPAFRSENLNELESHLRDSVATLEAKGVSAENAFIIASRRIGTFNALEGEFGKVNGATVWFERALWVLVATQLWSVIRNISTIGFFAGSWLLLILNWNHAVSGESARTIIGVIFSPLMISLASCIEWWRFMRRRQHGVPHFRKLLHRPLSIALVLFLVCAVLRVIAGSLFQMFRMPYAPPTFYREVGYSPVAEIMPFLLPVQLGEYAILALLTFWVARKRLRAAID